MGTRDEFGVEVVRMLRHEPCPALGPEAAYVLREVLVYGATAFEIRQHGAPGCDKRFGSRGDAESYLDGYLAGMERGALYAWRPEAERPAPRCAECGGSGRVGICVDCGESPCPKCRPSEVVGELDEGVPF